MSRQHIHRMKENGYPYSESYTGIFQWKQSMECKCGYSEEWYIH